MNAYFTLAAVCFEGHKAAHTWGKQPYTSAAPTSLWLGSRAIREQAAVAIEGKCGQPRARQCRRARRERCAAYCTLQNAAGEGGL